MDEPSALLAAIPALLGFYPTRSLVIVLLTRPLIGSTIRGVESIHAVVRFDLDTHTDPATYARDITDMVESMCLRENTTSTMAVVVDDRPTADETAAHLVGVLRASAIRLTNAWHLDTVVAHTRYHDLLTPGRGGFIEDPAASMVTFAHVMGGHQIRSSRHELVDLFTPDPGLTTLVSAQIKPALTRFHHQARALPGEEGAHVHRGATASWMLAQVRAIDNAVPDSGDLATMVVALRDPLIRDSLFCLAATEHRDRASSLWRHLTRATTGTDRARAATLYAYNAYYSGDTVVAAIALNIARNADPDHVMSALLEVALQHGVRPDFLAGILHSAGAIAADLGIDLTSTDTTNRSTN
ncbi:DUF4192 domain-containing protein [Nocardia sp. NPDC058658]|uniref:DUF4192 domain-containing protein n=1 Tax=Nocardia sp. NPDC058658 TaxID=3346580 RepID=UPI00365A86B0